MYAKNKKARAVIYCSGVVQGIGFRPFIYRQAVKRGLKGYVLNLGDAGVKIEVEGTKDKIKSFLTSLREEKPPLARYDKITVKWLEYKGEFQDFKIAKSKSGIEAGGVSYIPPDISICQACRDELFTKGNRRYLYPFIVCSECGPRFTVIESLPYDRERTSMREFPLCDECLREYENPLDRRYHAEPICCPKCGPKMFLLDRSGELIDVQNPIAEASRLLDEGYIVAIKGIGGFHIAVKTTEDEPIIELRKRRRKKQKPLAIMAKNLEVVKSFAIVSKKEESLLTSIRRPIVVLKKSENYYLSKWISPGLHTVGVMLPYSGIHELLLFYSKEPALVMTSGNFPGEPMVIDNSEALKRLGGIVDYFLMHNRRIVNRNDDSVVRFVDSFPTIIRRSRGYVPEPIEIPLNNRDLKIVAVGPELNVTGAVLSKKHCYMTQHIGDVDSLSTLNFLEKSIRFMMNLTRTEKINAIACDLNPAFYTTKLAEKLSHEFNVPLIRVQHHHAHLASLMAEYNLKQDEEVVGIAVDGVGYGTDGQAWGGEILIARYDNFKRLGHLMQQPMPGGDLCAKYPARMAVSMMTSFMDENDILTFTKKHLLKGFRHGLKEVVIILEQIKREIQLTYTSSLGRVLDAISAVLGVCYERTYEGEPAIKLESLAYYGDPKSVRINYEIMESNGCLVLDTSKILEDIINSINSEKAKNIAASAQAALAKGLAEISIELAKREGINKILMSGGVSYNEAIVKTVRTIIEREKLTFLRHRLVPPGDAGISVGQCSVAYAKLLAE